MVAQAEQAMPSGQAMRQLCGAKTRHGGPCRQPARPNGRCRMHGGNHTGRGTFKDGRYSKYLPVRLAARYEEARKDAQLLSLSDDLALLESRLCELLQALDTDDVAAQWGKALTVWQGAKEAAGAKNHAKQAEYFRELDGLLVRGADQAQQWAEIAEVMEQRRRLAETETRRLVHLQQFVTAQQVNLLVAALIRTVQTHVDDPGTRARLSVELARLLHREPPAGIGGGSPEPDP